VIYKKSRLTSQNCRTRMLHGSQTGPQVNRKAVPDFLRKIPSAKVSRVVAECISIFGAHGTRCFKVRGGSGE
jgi:hypothetical protein